MKVLWLTSWYPNKTDKFSGDFIQRHAFAVSQYVSIQVMYVGIASKNQLIQNTEERFTQNENLNEQIILIKPSQWLYPLNKIIDHIKYIQTYKKSIRFFLQKNDKPDIVHVHVAMNAGIIALWLKRKYRLPFVVTEHWTIYDPAAPDNFETKSFFFRNLNKRILKHASLLLPVSNHLGKNIQKKVFDIPFKRVLNVVDTNVFNYSPENKNEFSFIHVSVMNAQKNSKGILRAFAKLVHQLPQIKLFMVGPYTEQLAEYARALNIPHYSIEFTGEVEYKTVAQLMQKSNALVMFSNFENMPCVISEALCCGLPVISSHVGGIHEIIDESNGILINSNDETALFNALHKVYTHYNNYNREVISKKAAEIFSYKTVGKEIKAIYEEVLNK